MSKVFIIRIGLKVEAMTSERDEANVIFNFLRKGASADEFLEIVEVEGFSMEWGLEGKSVRRKFGKIPVSEKVIDELVETGWDEKMAIARVKKEITA